MATTTFLDLPDELILHVAELLWASDRCIMRLLAKRIDHLISPMLFEKLHFFQPAFSSPEFYASLSENIRLGKELVFSHCTKSMIIAASGFYPFAKQLPWLRFLNNLVPMLTNLHILRWSYWPREQPISPLVIDTFSSFGSIPSLRELVITVVVTRPFPGFILKSFSRLSSVSINWEHEENINQEFIDDIADLLGRCPNLEHFTFNIPRPYHPSEAPLLAHIFAGLPPTICLKLRQLDLTGLHVSADDFRALLRHLFSLKALQLMFNRHPDPAQQNGQICQLLLDNSIHLDELAIDTTHPASVIDYLSSYSGLEHLEFHSRHPGADTPEGVHRFFSSVLPLHSATLRVLKLGWTVESLWTKELAPEYLAQIETCQQLVELSCYITVTMGSAKRLLGLWLEAGMKLARLKYLFFFLTRRYQPSLLNGGFVYLSGSIAGYDMEEEVEKFAVAEVKRLTASRMIPFQVGVSAPSPGP